MTVSFEEIQKIRFMYRSMNVSITKLCVEFNRDYRTIKKYLEMDDFNEPDVCPRKRKSKLDIWKPVIDEWLIERNKKPEGREREWISSMTGISDGTVKNLLAEFNSLEV